MEGAEPHDSTTPPAPPAPSTCQSSHHGVACVRVHLPSEAGRFPTGRSANPSGRSSLCQVGQRHGKRESQKPSPPRSPARCSESSSTHGWIGGSTLRRCSGEPNRRMQWPAKQSSSARTASFLQLHTSGNTTQLPAPKLEVSGSPDFDSFAHSHHLSLILLSDSPHSTTPPLHHSIPPPPSPPSSLPARVHPEAAVAQVDGSLRLFQIGFDHHPDQFIQCHRRLPSQFAFGFRGVAQQ